MFNDCAFYKTMKFILIFITCLNLVADAHAQTELKSSLDLITDHIQDFIAVKQWKDKEVEVFQKDNKVLFSLKGQFTLNQYLSPKNIEVKTRKFKKNTYYIIYS